MYIKVYVKVPKYYTISLELECVPIALKILDLSILQI